MFHGKLCLSIKFHFLIVTVCLHFNSITSVTSWCLNVIIKQFLVTDGILKCVTYISVNTFNIVTAVCACLSPNSTSSKEEKEEEEEKKEEEEEEEEEEEDRKRMRKRIYFDLRIDYKHHA